MSAGEGILLCRTCGKPRGDNIAEGTRCAACGRAQALILWISVSVAAAASTFARSGEASTAAVSLAVALVVTPVAFVSAVLLHELAHAGAALLLGQTVTRVLVGEGVLWKRWGRDFQLVFGSVLLGNGLTTVLDLRHAGYRRRLVVMLLAAPVVSALLAATVYIASAGWPAPARTAARLFALANGVLVVITSIPIATFNGRVWSDVAAALWVARASEDEIVEHMLQSARDRMGILLDSGMAVQAIATARAAVAAQPSASLAHGLLAFALHTAGQSDEARLVARHALDDGVDDAHRAYLHRFLES